MHAQDEMDIQALKAGTDSGKPNIKNIKIKHFQPTGGNQKEIIARSAKPVSTRMQIREMLSNGSLDALEELVLQGHGDRLLGESATNPLVRDFIHMVPIYMERIYEIHRAVARGRLRDVQALLDRKKLALARDPLGATPLHKAVMYGHRDIVEYIAMNFPLSKDTKDLDGRTPLHYAAGLKDNHEIYNLLIAFSANPLVLDYKGKTAEYYLQFPEHLHLEQLLKQSQRANANYMANHANRIKAVASPKRKSPYPTRAALALDFNGNIRPTNGDVTNFSLFLGLEINSANIKRWVREEDLEKLEGAVLEGYGEKVALQKSDNAKLQKYISDQVPLLVRKIEAIHIAVSNDDLTELQNQLHETDNMVLAKDHFGMAPIHRAVLMNKPETLAFLIDRFPETVNARDKEGRTALHYAAAMSREPGASNYFKMLLEAGADSRIRDNQGRSPEYYRTHHVPIPHKLNQHQKFSKKQRSKSEPPPQQRMKKLPGINGAAGSLPQVTMDKINNWLQSGDLDSIKDFVQEGYGQHLVGKTSWNEDVRQYLKSLPSYLMNLGSVFHAVERGDLQSLDKQIGNDENLLRSKNAEGSTVMHHAVLHDQLNVVNYFLDKYPTLLNIKDRNGRTPLHVAGQQKNQYLYTILATSGADPMILDQKGRTAEFYMNSSTKPTVRPQISPQSSSPENDSSGEKSSLSPEESPKEEEPTKETVEQKTPTPPKKDTPQTEETDGKDDKPESEKTPESAGADPEPDAKPPDSDKTPDLRDAKEEKEEAKETETEKKEEEEAETAEKEEEKKREVAEPAQEGSQKSAQSGNSEAPVSSSGILSLSVNLCDSTDKKSQLGNYF
ncbi:tankyrase-1 [Trichonephila clavata]|uniref:Tankyrase-1 n=1 Tax=Trichonephila clavata TaxID=2740835 RepID=A0A8X6GIT8_TRICU|nr:tankyrase-1 [Trichonephila clavata]